MIQIIKGDKTYLARYSGRDKAEVIKLFGTDTIPTPYTLEADIFTVAERIQALNPDINVIIY